RSALRFQCHSECLCLYPCGQRRIDHGCTAMCVGTEQAGRQWRSNFRNQPQLVNLIWRQWRKVVGEEDQLPTVAQIEGLSLGLRRSLGSDQGYLLCFGRSEKVGHFLCAGQFCLLVEHASLDRCDVSSQIRILAHQQHDYSQRSYCCHPLECAPPGSLGGGRLDPFRLLCDCCQQSLACSLRGLWAGRREGQQGHISPQLL